ncbi:MAG: hypothetical protein SFV15_18765 [Polyangiaceae bacterium]|nr:hypothetical protein [Polyangiaceae bacterium]
MGQDRLTRQELGWLLAQEARGAAKALRSDIVRPPSAAAIITQAEPEPAAVETTLDQLDDAISMFAALQSGPQVQRRGRIDLAALLYAVAPKARIAMEPGAGTEVFGVEAELRRMLHVLVNHTTTSFSGQDSSSPEVRIHRQGDWVRISVELGPDSSPTAELERRWLSRMTVRHGGRLDLVAGTLSILLPADGASDQSEVAELRKELEQAQQLGEAYARELASVFATGDAPQLAGPSESAIPQATEFGLAIRFSTQLSRILRRFSDSLRADADALKENGADIAPLELRLHGLNSLLLELSRAAETPEAERSTDFDLTQAVQAAILELTTKAERNDVSFSVNLPQRMASRTHKHTAELLLKCLLTHAIDASPRGSKVLLRLTQAAEEARLAIEDAGPVVPVAARESLVAGRLDPTSVGRPSGVSLLLANAAVGKLGGCLLLGESQSGNALLQAVFPLYQLG